jgi:phosphoglycerate dehydrogenase-like enzyme
MPRRTLPGIVVLSGEPLFASFFDRSRRRRLSRSFDWTRSAARAGTPVLCARLAEADGLVTTWDSPSFGAELLAVAPRLRLVAHCGGEVKARFSRDLFSRLTIANAPGPMAPYVAELALTFLLMSARHVDDYRETLRRPSNAIYKDAHLHGRGQETLRNRTVGLVGFGRIGQAVAALLKPLGARVVVHDPHVSRSLASRSGIAFLPLGRLLPQVEFLVLAASLTDETRGMIDRKALARLPGGATVVNVARGGLLELGALTQEVQRGRLRCALDVTDPLEPLPLRHPLRRLRGAIVTPHVGAGAVAVRRAMADIVLESLERFFRGERVKTRVTPAMLDLMT